MQAAARMGKVWTAQAGANNQMRLNLAERSGLVMRLQKSLKSIIVCCGKCESAERENPPAPEVQGA